VVGTSSKPAPVADAIADERARSTQDLVAVWWRRVPAVLWRPRHALVALRETDEDDMAARQEPLLAVVLLAGMAAVLMMGGSVTVDQSVDAVVVAAITFIAGGLYGAAGYVVLGAGVWVGVKGAGRETSFRQARHLVGVSAVPMALAFFVVAALVAVAYGLDFFRGGAGSGAGTVAAVGAPFVAWSAALLVAGLRITYRLAWLGVLTALLLGGVLMAAFVSVPLVL
jgi:hypothetical protein